MYIIHHRVLLIAKLSKPITTAIRGGRRRALYTSSIHFFAATQYDEKYTSLYIFHLRVCDKRKLFELKPPAIRGGGD